MNGAKERSPGPTRMNWLAVFDLLLTVLPILDPFEHLGVDGEGGWRMIVPK